MTRTLILIARWIISTLLGLCIGTLAVAIGITIGLL